jgi:hypothetical protein
MKNAEITTNTVLDQFLKVATCNIAPCNKCFKIADFNTLAILFKGMDPACKSGHLYG